MNVLFENLVDDATLFSDGAVLGFPLNNVTDTRVSRIYRRNGNTDAIIIDLGTAQDISAVSIVDHNFTCSTITLEGSANDVFAPVDITVEVDVEEYMIFETFETTASRYWRITINDPGNPEDIQMGRIGLGASVALPYLDPAMELPKISTTDISFSRTQQSYRNLGVVYRGFRVTFPYIEDEQRRAIEEAWEGADGIPVFMEFPEIPDEPALYGLFSPGELSVSYDKKIRQHALSVEIVEVF